MNQRSVRVCPSPNRAPNLCNPAIIAQELVDAAEHSDLAANRILAPGEVTGDPETFELDALGYGVSCPACKLRTHHRQEHGNA